MTTQHSEVEGLVADPSWKVRLKALSSVNIDREGGIYLRSIKDIYDLIEDALTTHGAQEYQRGLEEGAKMVTDSFDIKLRPQTDVTKN